ncbi:MAG: YczE/YyaS/YitT family protein [Nocardioidaceae bacterium]
MTAIGTGPSGHATIGTDPVPSLRSRLPRRLIQLYAGLALYGWSMSMMIRSGLGLDPWDVFHDGVRRHVGLSFGTVVIIVGALVLLLWIPLRQWPGFGTVSNVVVIGLVTDLGLSVLGPPVWMPARIGLLLGGIVANGMAGGMYIGALLGPGPRDGLMTGLARRTGRSIRLVRTSLELTVLGTGWLLGGVVGLGTVLYALSIGPLVQFFLARFTVTRDRSAHRSVSGGWRRSPRRPVSPSPRPR